MRNRNNTRALQKEIAKKSLRGTTNTLVIRPTQAKSIKFR